MEFSNPLNYDGNNFVLTAQGQNLLLRNSEHFRSFYEVMSFYSNNPHQVTPLKEAKVGDILVRAPSFTFYDDYEDFSSLEKIIQNQGQHHYLSVISEDRPLFSKVFLHSHPNDKSPSLRAFSFFRARSISFEVATFNPTSVFILRPEHYHILTFTDCFDSPEKHCPVSPSL